MYHQKTNAGTRDAIGRRIPRSSTINRNSNRRSEHDAIGIEGSRDSPRKSEQRVKLTTAEKKALLFQGLAEIEKHIEEKDRVVALIRTTRKKLVANGFAPKVIDFALRIRKDEDGEMIELRRAEMEVARFLNHPIGTQPELPLVMEDRTPDVDKAFDLGVIAGAQGATCNDPYATGSPNGQSWIRGWHEGQATITSAFRKLEAKAAAEADESDDAEGDED